MAKKKEPYQFWDPNEKPRKPGGKKKEVGSVKRNKKQKASDERWEKMKKGKPDPSKPQDKSRKPESRKSESSNSKPETPNPKPTPPDQPIRLNRFIAQAGICSRREADELIKNGKIRLNGKVVTELGTSVSPGKDEIKYEGKRLSSQQFIYILLNKPKNTLTTTDDPMGRKTIIDIISKTTEERVFPVGRLDRNTTGLILLTNDGGLAEKLTNPANKIRKLYHVRLDKPVPEEDLTKLLAGIELEDGLAKADKIDYVAGKTTSEVGIQVHSGKNRIVRRMFEALGYKVLSLDRVMIAHLNKKQLPRGKWRTLSDKEVQFLKMI